MRRIGTDLSHWAANWSDDVLPFISRAKEAGFAGAEIALIEPQAMDYQRLRDELDRTGMAATTGMGLTPEADITSPDAHIRQAGLDRLKMCLEGTKILGGDVLGGVTFAPWMYFPPGHDIQPYRERSAKQLQKAGQLAGELGILLCIEVLNRFETSMFNTVADALAFLEMVDDPHVKLHLDTFHMNIEEDRIGDAILQAGDKIGHFHCAASNRKRPGLGHINWSEVKRALDAVDYQGWLVIESFPKAGNEVGRALRIWRDLGDDLDEEARLGADFLLQNLV